METMRQMSCKKLYKFQILDFLILRTRGSFTLEKRWKDGKKVKLCLAIWWRGGISEVKKLKIPRVVLAMSALTIPAAVDWSRGQQQRYHYETEDLSTPNAYTAGRRSGNAQQRSQRTCVSEKRSDSRVCDMLLKPKWPYWYLLLVYECHDFLSRGIQIAQNCGITVHGAPVCVLPIIRAASAQSWYISGRFSLL